MIRGIQTIEATFLSLGFGLVRQEAGGMDSGIATFSNGLSTISITKDRGQWQLDAARAVLEPIGLWKAFDSDEAFSKAVERYLRAVSA